VGLARDSASTGGTVIARRRGQLTKQLPHALSLFSFGSTAQRAAPTTSERYAA